MSDLATGATASANGQNPTLTVVIPAYNCAPTLKRAVDSVMVQGVPDCEVLIVDDVSTDNTLAVARELERVYPCVRVISQQKNGGPSAARNAAFKVARGDWIALLDSDDAWAPERLWRMIELAKQEEADFLADNVVVVAPDDYRPIRKGYSAEKLTRLSPLTFTALVEDVADTRHEEKDELGLGYLKPVMRRAFIEANGLHYDDDIRCAEDMLFYGRALLKGARFVLIPEAHYLYTLGAVTARRGRARMIQNFTDLVIVGRRMTDAARAASGDMSRALDMLEQRNTRLRRRLKILRVKKLLLDQPALRKLIYKAQGRRPE